jgi:hypothetical protein
MARWFESSHPDNVKAFDPQQVEGFCLLRVWLFERQ